MKLKSLISAVLGFVLLAGWFTPAYAADPVITSVTPNHIVNDVANTLTVEGSDFDDTAVVLLQGYGALNTNVLNSHTLTASVPSGIPAGDYDVYVNMSGFAPIPGGSINVANPIIVPPTSTPTPIPFGRPQLVVGSYDSGKAQAGKEFKLEISFENAGSANAIGVQAAFSSPDLVPTGTGGVQVLGNVAAGASSGVSQKFLALDSITGKTVVVVDVSLSYYDNSGTAYSDKLSLSVPVKGGTTSGGGYSPTATPTGVNTAQLVITSYSPSVDPLQPGDQFQLDLTVNNMGNTKAKRVTMIVGGGSSGSSGGTPQPGGVSGGSGEFTNFAPVGTSNIQSLGDLAAGSALKVTQNLIVNVSTTPGAYPMKVTFSYVNENGEVVNDDQVITLLVYGLPNLDISFYRPPDPFFAGQPGALPIQIVNLGKRTSVLGNMTIEMEGGTIDPSSTLVGSLDPGGYFTFDSTVFPDAAGPLQLNFTVNYTDDFNQERTITKTLDITVEEAFIDPSLDPSLNGGEEVIVTEETFFQKAWRFILGLFGLDSSAPASGGGGAEPLPQEQQIVPMPSGGKG